MMQPTDDHQIPVFFENSHRDVIWRAFLTQYKVINRIHILSSMHSSRSAAPWTPVNCTSV